MKQQQKKQSVVAVTDSAGNEAAAFADIVEWSKGCPAWQRDALRRLCLQDQLDADDIADLIALCKDGVAAIPLDAAHVKNAAAASETVTLKSLHTVQYVNALAPGEMLTFDKIGLTVLYGDNGSGKSGYARIFEKSVPGAFAQGRNHSSEHIRQP
jgi:hypothetical protein